MSSRGAPHNPYRCTLHAGVAAAWGCLGCERRLCEACAAPGGPEHAPLAFCAHCGGGTVPLTVPGVADSFRGLLGLTLRLSVGRGTLGTLVGVVLVTGLLARTGDRSGGRWAVLLLLASAALALLTSALLHASAQGPDRLSAHEATARLDVRPAALGLWPLCALLLALPQLSPGGPLWREGLSWAGVGVALAVGVLGPPLSVAAAVGHPLRTVPRVWGLGADAHVAMAATFGVVLVGWHLLAAAVWIERNDPVLGFFSVGLQASAVLALLWLARLHGLLLHVHAAELGYPLAAHHRVPVAPGAHPHAAPFRPPTPVRPPPAPIALEPVPEAPALVLLTRALAARDAEGALAAFSRLDAEQRARLDPETYVQLGRAAASRGEWARAREALLLGTRVRTAHPATATACVLLARLLEERLGEPAQAAALYRHAAAHYPDTEAAAFARTRLTPAAG